MVRVICQSFTTQECSQLSTELPAPTLARALVGEDPLQLRAHGIQLKVDNMLRRAEDWQYDDDVSDCLHDIRLLAQLPGGRPIAMEGFAGILFALCAAMDHSKIMEEAQGFQNVMDLVDGQFAELAKMAHAHFMAILAAGDDWDPWPLWHHINELKENSPGWNFEAKQMAARWYLRKWHSWRVANTLSDKVAGHILPPELVEMVRDYIYNDIDLTIGADEWRWYCGGGCERRSPKLTLDCEYDGESGKAERDCILDLRRKIRD